MKEVLEDLEKLRNYKAETDLIKIVQEIDDRVIFRGYTDEQIFCLANEIMKINLLSVKYETREEILYFLCNVAAYYGLLGDIDWENVIDIKDKLEDDLKEYVAEIIEPMQQNVYCKNMDK